MLRLRSAGNRRLHDCMTARPQDNIINMKSEIQNPKSEITILLVDDTKELNEASSRVLRSAGYTVIQAFDGNECLQILKNIKPDIILLDVVMEGMDGIEVCRRIKSTPDGVNQYVILLSGLRISSDNQSEGLEAGADGYITRPVQNRELLARVEAALRLVKAEKNLRLALERSKVLENELQSLNATKDLFFSIIAHDLKNPFNTILGFSELIIDAGKEMNSDTRDQYLKVIASSASQAYNLMENLLLWASAQRGIIEFSPANTNIGECIAESVSIVESQASTKNISIESFVNSECTVYCDRNMVSTILRNLLTNAIKFTPINGRISVASSILNGNVEISVTDTGVGISKFEQNKLFMIENSVKHEGTEKEKGTGLGLILCKDFVEKNGGRIWVESEVGKGSKFIFTLPK